MRRAELEKVVENVLDRAKSLHLKDGLRSSHALQQAMADFQCDSHVIQRVEDIFLKSIVSMKISESKLLDFTLLQECKKQQYKKR